MNTTDLYPDIYALTPVREVQPGWWKLRWRPLWGKTFRISKARNNFIGLLLQWHHVDNGWHRSFRIAEMRVGLGFVALDAWIRWNYVVHQDGPSDFDTRIPLSIRVDRLARSAAGAPR